MPTALRGFSPLGEPEPLGCVAEAVAASAASHVVLPELALGEEATTGRDRGAPSGALGRLGGRVAESSGDRSGAACRPARGAPLPRPPPRRASVGRDASRSSERRSPFDSADHVDADMERALTLRHSAEGPSRTPDPQRPGHRGGLPRRRPCLREAGRAPPLDGVARRTASSRSTSASSRTAGSGSRRSASTSSTAACRLASWSSSRRSRAVISTTVRAASSSWETRTTQVRPLPSGRDADGFRAQRQLRRPR